LIGEASVSKEEHEHKGHKEHKGKEQEEHEEAEQAKVHEEVQPPDQDWVEINELRTGDDPEGKEQAEAEQEESDTDPAGVTAPVGDADIEAMQDKEERMREVADSKMKVNTEPEFEVGSEEVPYARGGVPQAAILEEREAHLGKIRREQGWEAAESD
jgi:hypothetical protein